MGNDEDTNLVITLDPVPPTQGSKVKVSYTGKIGTVLYLDWHPSGTPATVTIGADGTASVTVPTTATSLIVSDPAGGASPVTTTVSP